MHSNPEHVNFETSVYGFLSAGLSMAASTSAQVIGPFEVALANTAHTLTFVEPAHALSVGQQIRLDDMTRIVVMAARDDNLSVDDPLFTLRLSRSLDITGNNLNIALPPITGEGHITVLENEVPHDFAGHDNSPQINASFQVEFVLQNPTNADAQNVAVSLLFLPTRRGNASVGRGNQLSGLKFY